MRRSITLTLLFGAALPLIGMQCPNYELYELSQSTSEPPDSGEFSIKQIEVNPGSYFPGWLYCTSTYKTVQIDDHGLIMTPFSASRIIGIGNLLVFVDIQNNSQNTYSLVEDSARIFRYDKDYLRYVDKDGQGPEHKVGAVRQGGIFVERLVDQKYFSTDRQSFRPGERVIATIHFDVSHTHVGNGILTFRAVDATSGKISTYALKMTDIGKRSVSDRKQN